MRFLLSGINPKKSNHPKLRDNDAGGERMNQTTMVLVSAIISGLLATVITIAWQARAEKIKKRKDIFATLMAYRYRLTHAECVNALNSIQVVFYKDKKVIDAKISMSLYWVYKGNSSFFKRIKALFEAVYINPRYVIMHILKNYYVRYIVGQQ